jgi:phospholipid transport system substrate-binding protein
MTLRRIAQRLAVVLLALGMAGPASAGPATDRLKPEIDRVVATLENASLRGPGKAQERRQTIRAITDGVFDWTKMARRSLGPHWDKRTSAEKQEFVALFRDLIERAYITQIERYSGEQLRYAPEVSDGDHATVATRVRTKKGQDIAIDYHMDQAGGRFMVYDVSIEHLSLVATYRAQFNEIIRTSSYQALIEKIRKRPS